MPQSPYANRDIVIADGSIRSGKTVSMINGFIDWSLSEFENENFILAGKSRGALAKNVINPLKKMLNAKGLHYNHIRTTEEPRIEIGSNYYYLYGANNVSSKDTLTGLTAAGSFADQVELFPENFVSTMIDRCSIEGSRHWWNCNPQGPYHYIKTDYIDVADEKSILRLKFNLDDNLTLSEKIKARYKRLHSGVWYQRNILGMWVLAEGLIYDMFSDEHLVNFADIPNHKQEWIGVDYGTTNDTAFVLVRLGQDNNLYIVDEYRWGEKKQGVAKTDVSLADDLEKFIEKHNAKPEWIFVDPSAKSFITELYSRRDEFPQFNRISRANNDVVNGIQRVSSLLGTYNLYVSRQCEDLRQEFHTYSWDEKAQEKGEDKPIKKYDHGLDALRYVANGNIRLIEYILRRAA